MRFAELEQQFRALEERLLRGELAEDVFLTQVAELRLVDEAGRRWMLSARTGRWLVHDGRQWVYAQPPEDDGKVAPEAATQAEDTAAPTAVAAPAPPSFPRPPTRSRSLLPRLAGMTVVLSVLIVCLIGGGLASWVFILRDLGRPTAAVTTAPVVAMVETYTPRPATPTYTPTLTPTPSRTPTPTDTPVQTDTPVPSDTPLPTPTPFATSTSFPTATPTPLSPTPTPRPTVTAPTVISALSPLATPSPAAEAVTNQNYIVQLGDTLYEIAVRFGVSAEALAEANNITNPALIRPGQVLVIPSPATAASTSGTPRSSQTYTVQPGDTLSGIAARFDVSTQALAEANGITDLASIRSGQVLVIPVPGATLPTPTWTPIVLRTPSAAVTPTVAPTSARATATATQAPTRTGAPPTPKPTNTPRPAATSTAEPVALTGKIAFAMWNRYIGKFELYVSRLDGSGRNMIGEGFRQPQFRQDGNLLAANGDGAPNLETLVTMNPSGGEKLGVSQHAEDSFPTWSPDGAIVAFSSDSWGDGRVLLGIVKDMLAPEQNWIAMGNGQVEGENPYWMAGGRIVYQGCDSLAGGGSRGLYWVGQNGGSYHRVTTHESDTAPAGSGTRVAFMSARDGNWEVYVIDLGGGAEQRLTNNGAQDGLPTWSPDGRSIAFVSDRGGGWAIWVMHADGSNQRKLFDLEGGYGVGNYDWTTERISWAP